jgi:hypothetical protein
MPTFEDKCPVIDHDSSLSVTNIILQGRSCVRLMIDPGERWEGGTTVYLSPEVALSISKQLAEAADDE